MSVEMSTALTEQQVRELAQATSEPSWMLERRLQAFNRSVTAPWPVWDRTKIDPADFQEIAPFRFPGEIARTELPAAVQQVIDAAGDEGILLVQLDSGVVYRQVPQRFEEQGLIVTSLDEALREHPELVQEHLLTAISPDEDKLISLHAAFTVGGIFVYAPKNLQIDVPVQFFVYSEAKGLGLFPHVLVVAEEGAELTFVETYESAPDAEITVVQALEVIAKANARITLGSIQAWGDATCAFNTRRAKLDRDASLQLAFGDFGGRLSRVASRVLLEGNGSESQAYAVFFADGRQHIDTGLVMNHIGEYTGSDMLTRGVLKDQARAVYRALTDIEAGARNTTAFQREKTLVLSADARVDAIPELEIEETEVQAGHAATVGQVDEEQLFYLMSRGLPEATAVHLIVSGFFDPVLERIPLESVRNHMRALIDRKMAR